MSGIHKAAVLAVLAGALSCVASAEPGSGPLRVELRHEAKSADARASQVHCRIYFGCAPIARASSDAAHPLPE